MTTIHQTSLTNNNLTRPHQHQLQHHAMSSNPSLPSSSSTPSSSSSSASTSLAATTATPSSSSLSSTTTVPSLASSVAKLLPSSTFSFTSPYHTIDTSTATTPSSSSSPCTPLLTASALTAKALRRVSLALPSSPRVFPAWSFRDDTSVGNNTQINGGSGIQGSAEDGERKALKLRRVAMDDNDLGRAMPMGLQQRSAVVSATATSAMVRQGGNPSPPLPPPPPPATEKKQRKKWTMEETQMLVSGCNKWGVGNWKAILNDPDLKFDNRSPVDLKDRFRTYFPDAYKQHYPNAKTHLSSKVRSSLPDGSSIFEKTRSKKRRPFTEDEDRALKAGYDRHGTVWATIVKDPIFQEQNRRSTDLRDRFRNAFPDLYMAAGYKPRLSAKKKKLEEFGRGGEGVTGASGTAANGNASTAAAATTTSSSAAAASGAEMSSPVMGGVGQSEKRVHPIPLRSATDDFTIGRSGLGPVRRKRRHTTTGQFRGGTKSVPESTTNSEDEDDACGGALSEGEREKDNHSPPSYFASPAFLMGSGSVVTPTTTTASTPAAGSTSTTTTTAGTTATPTTTTTSASPSGGPSPSGSGSVSQTVASTPSQQPQDDLYDSTDHDHSEIEMDIQTLESLNDSLEIRDYMPSDSIADSSQSTAWSSSLDTPVHSWVQQASSGCATSPASTGNHNNGNSASSGNGNGNGMTGSPTMESDCDFFIPPHSPVVEQVRLGIASGGSGNVMIGKSAWGPADWLSPNPRLDPTSHLGHSGLNSNTSNNNNGNGNSGSGSGNGGSFSPTHHPSSPTPFSSTQAQPLSLSQLSLNQLINGHQGFGGGGGGAGLNHFVSASASSLSPSHSSHLNQFFAPSGFGAGAGGGGSGGNGGGGNIFDRYDLFPSASSSHLDLDLDFISEGFNPTDTDTDAFSTFSDPSTWMTGAGAGSGGVGSSGRMNGDDDMIGGGGGSGPGSGAGGGFGGGFGGGGGAGAGRRGGFTHHSSEAGDLIFGARTHQPSGGFGFGFGFGLGFGGAFGSASSAGHGSTGAGASQTGSGSSAAFGGLGLEGVSSREGKDENGTRTPALPGIDEIELAGISLDDRDVEEDDAILVDEVEKDGIAAGGGGGVGGRLMYPDEDPISPMLSPFLHQLHPQPLPLAPQPLALEEIVGLPPSDSEDDGDDGQDVEVTMNGMDSDHGSGMGGMDVMGVLNLSPPTTPLIGGIRRSRGLRSSRRTGHASGMYTPGPRTSSHAYDYGGGGSHNRSVSVPPSEHRSPVPARPAQSQSRTPNLSRKYKALPSTAASATAVTPTRTTFQPFQLPSLPANLLGGRDGQGTVAPAQTQGQSSTHQTQTSPQIRPGTANSALSSVNSPNLTSGANLAYPGHTPQVVHVNGSGFMTPGDTTPDLSFLDLHYFAPASSSLSTTLSTTGDLHCSNPSLSSSPPSQHQAQQQQHHQHHSHQHHHQHLGHNTTPFYHPGGTNAKSDDLWGALGHSHGRAQALDLAQSLSLTRAHGQANQNSNNNKPLCIEPSSLMQFSSHSPQATGGGNGAANGNGSGTRSGSRTLNIGQQMLSTLQTGACQTLSGNGGAGVGMGRGHQRGQSATAALSLAVAPQDLMIRKGKGSDNNKRKRASWDGGAG